MKINYLICMLLLLILTVSCSSTFSSQLTSPDGTTIAITEHKYQDGIWVIGPEPPEIKYKWVKLKLVSSGDVKYNSGFETVHRHSGGYNDLCWSPDSKHIAYRYLGKELRIISTNGSLVWKASIVKPDEHAAISSFKWINNKQILVVWKHMYGLEKENYYPSTAGSAISVNISTIGIINKKSNILYSEKIDGARFIYRSIDSDLGGTCIEEISPLSNYVAFSDGFYDSNLCIYDTTQNRVTLRLPIKGSIEGIWWKDKNKVILLESESRYGTPIDKFKIIDLSQGIIKDVTKELKPLWNDNNYKKNWFTNSSK